MLFGTGHGLKKAELTVIRLLDLEFRIEQDEEDRIGVYAPCGIDTKHMVLAGIVLGVFDLARIARILVLDDFDLAAKTVFHLGLKFC